MSSGTTFYTVASANSVACGAIIIVQYCSMDVAEWRFPWRKISMLRCIVWLAAPGNAQQNAGKFNDAFASYRAGRRPNPSASEPLSAMALLMEGFKASPRRRSAPP